MREQFRAYYSPTDDEFDRLWDEAIIVFDANALLNLFRYSVTTRDEWLALMEAESTRLWIPHQVGLEFHRNRRHIASQQESDFRNVETALNEAESTVGKAIEGLQRHPTSEAEVLTELLKRHMRKIRKKFERARAQYFEDVVHQQAHDNTLEKVTVLYEGKVGAPYSEAELEAIYKEGESRYARKIPPGYMDERDKSGNQKYGDLVLWRQIIAYNADAKKPLLFVTDDQKEDWWQKSGTRTLGPRPELIEEHFEATGQRAHFYQPRAFLKFAKKRGKNISEGALAEAKTVSASRAQYDRSEVQGMLARLAKMQEPIGAMAAANLRASQLANLSGVDLSNLRSVADLYSSPRSNALAEAVSAAGVGSVSNLLESLRTPSFISHFAEQEARQRSLLHEALYGDHEQRERVRGYINDRGSIAARADEEEYQDSASEADVPEAKDLED